MVWWTLLWTGPAVPATVLVKDTVFYLKICPAIGHIKLHIFLRTNFSALQSKEGPFSESSDQRLSGHPPQKFSLAIFVFVLAVFAGLSNIYVCGQKHELTISVNITVLWLSLCNCPPFLCVLYTYRTQISARRQWNQLFSLNAGTQFPGKTQHINK